MVAEQTNSSSGQAAAAQGQQAEAAGASLTQQTTDASAQGQAQTASAPARPEGLPESLWDEKTGLKVKDVEDLAKFKTETDAKRAALPAKADDYKAEFATDFRLPDGWEIKTDHPLWAAGRQFAHENGLSQEQFSKLATLFVQDQITQSNAIQDAAKARDASLGPNGGARVEALNTWFKGVFGDKVGAQFASALFTKDMVEGFEKLQTAVTSQGITSFTGTGRTEGRTDGKPNNWETMSPLDRRTWDLTHNSPNAR